MSYKIVIPPSLEIKIKGLFIELGKEIYLELKKLGEHPGLGKTAQSGVFTGRLRYTFKIFRPPLVFQFSVAYTYMPNEEEILISDIVYTVGNPPQQNPWPTKS